MVDPCTYTEIDVANTMLRADRVISDINETTLTTGTWYERSCNDGTMDLVSWTPPAGEAPALPTPQALAQQAVITATVTTPDLSLNPFYQLDDGRRATLKNAETWIWVNSDQWTTLTPRVEIGPVWAEATITPHTIIVNVGDSTTAPYSCIGPGTPIPPGTPVNQPSPTCSLQFTTPTDGGTWPVSIQVSYTVTWTGYDGTTAITGTLPDLLSEPTVIPLAVLTAKPQLIDPAYN